MSMKDKELIAANCISVMGCGILILGPSGSGKSDLSLRLLSSQSHFLEEPCSLIADDQTLVWQEKNQLFGAAPPQIAGKLEVRGVGVLKFKYLPENRIFLVIELVDREKIERIPNLSVQKATIAGIDIPKLYLYPFEASACEKLFTYIMAMKRNALANDI